MKRKENGQALAGRWCRRLSGGGWRKLWDPDADGASEPSVLMVTAELPGCWSLDNVLGSPGILLR